MYALDQPTLAEMLAPTLESHGQRVVMRNPYTGTLAIVPLHDGSSVDTIALACEVHYGLGRGLLVLV